MAAASRPHIATDTPSPASTRGDGEAEASRRRCDRGRAGRRCRGPPRPQRAGRGRPGWRCVDRTAGVAERRRGLAGPAGDDLGADRHGGLLGRARPDVEPDRGHDPLEAGVVDPRLSEARDAVGVRASAPHRPEVSDARAERRHDRGHVELHVVGEHAHRVARSERRTDAREVTVGPVAHDLVGHREPGSRREDLPGVADGDPVAEQLRLPYERGGEVDRTEDDELRRRRERLDEHVDDALARLAVPPVVPGGRRARPRARRARRARRPGRGRGHRAMPIGERVGHARAASHPRPGRRRSSRARPVARCAARRATRRTPACCCPCSSIHQSSGSTKTWIVPPQVSPTANASSSE